MLTAAQDSVKNGARGQHSTATARLVDHRRGV